jgi:hypothetical protein
MTLGMYCKISRANTITISPQKNPTSLCSNNMEHLSLIRKLLKTLYNYVNKVHHQIDPDFRNLTKLVS